jgi:predicted dehydrogenase
MMRSAIVGCGSIAGVHSAVLSQSEYTRLCACADIIPGRAQALAEKYHARAYESLEALLDREPLDVLHICTPHYLHVSMAQAALSRGVHVFMEKPAATSADGFASLLTAAEKSGRNIGVCFQNRYNPPVRYVREAIQSGQAGRVLGARAFVTWARNEKYYTDSGWRGQKAAEGGGALMNQSIHTMDLLVYLLGAPISVESSMHNRHLSGVIEVEDTVEAYIRFQDTSALFYATTAYCTDSEVMLEIVCENAIYTMQGSAVTQSLPDGTTNVIKMECKPFLGKDYWGSSHKLCIDDFYRAVQNGAHFSLSPGDIAPTMNLVFACYESASTGKPVLL